MRGQPPAAGARTSATTRLTILTQKIGVFFVRCANENQKRQTGDFFSRGGFPFRHGGTGSAAGAPDGPWPELIGSRDVT
ncbi:uncharacterized protein PG986_007743 [Apiospora aurea]|uniref:Uncharacterized protein n=1 Tax=Apiospora aurea TaxID=335848 RepID=A0ABR1QDF5_9PEZI